MKFIRRHKKRFEFNLLWSKESFAMQPRAPHVARCEAAFVLVRPAPRTMGESVNVCPTEDTEG